MKQEWCEEIMKKLVDAKNQIRQKGIDENYDYIFFCDADWILPKNVIERLISHDKDLVGVLYNYGKGRYSWPSVARTGKAIMDVPMRVSLDRLDLYTWEDIFELAPRLIKCYGAGIGLVSRKVFVNVPWRHCPVRPLGEDIQFWHETNDKGFEWYADLSFKIPHLNVSWKDEKVFKNEIE